jgi:hypothetical protein
MPDATLMRPCGEAESGEANRVGGKWLFTSGNQWPSHVPPDSSTLCTTSPCRSRHGCAGHPSGRGARCRRSAAGMGAPPTGRTKARWVQAGRVSLGWEQDGWTWGRTRLAGPARLRSPPARAGAAAVIRCPTRRGLPATAKGLPQSAAAIPDPAAILAEKQSLKEPHNSAGCAVNGTAETNRMR